MPRVHFVRKARKDNPVCKAGGSYYWWKFRYGGKRYSLTFPKRHELTQSSFLSSLYQLQDEFENRVGNAESVEDLQTYAEELRGDLEVLRDECQESLDNMPEHLQDTSDSGITLTERIENLESWENELENIDFEPEEGLDEQGKEQWIEDIREAISNSDPGIG